MTRTWEIEGREIVVSTDGRVRRSPVPKGQDPAMFRHVVAAVDMLYRQNGQIPTVKDILKSWSSFDEKTVVKILSLPETQEALRMRGVELDHKAGLTDEQLMALLVLQNPADGRSTESKLKQFGISMQKYRAWMRNPLFSAEMVRQSEHNLSDATQMAMNRLIANAESGDQRAIEKILEISGRWNPQAQELQNARAVVLTVLEAVQRHVTDKETIRAIMDDVSGKVQVMSITSGVKELT